MNFLANLPVPLQILNNGHTVQFALANGSSGGLAAHIRLRAAP